jgi:hypothetical protein
MKTRTYTVEQLSLIAELDNHNVSATDTDALFVREFGTTELVKAPPEECKRLRSSLVRHWRVRSEEKKRIPRSKAGKMLRRKADEERRERARAE